MPSTQHQRRTQARETLQRTRAAILRAQLTDATREAEQRQQRFDAICKQMPLFISPKTRARYRRYLEVATAHLGAKALERVVWPWNKLAERRPMGLMSDGRRRRWARKLNPQVARGKVR